MAAAELSAFDSLCNRFRTATPEAAVRGAVARLASEVGSEGPPVALRPLLERLRIEFRWSNVSLRSGRGEASLSPHGDGYRIWLHSSNFRNQWRRTRFTIAHEIVHVLLYSVLNDKHLISSLDGSREGHQRLERLCDIGAAEILMPSVFFRNDIRQFGINPSGLLALYDRYLVSREALVWRVAEILPRGAIFRWRKMSRHGGEKTRKRVVASYPGYQQDAKRPWLPAGATAQHISYEGEDFEDIRGPLNLGKIEIVLGGRRSRGLGFLSRFCIRNRLDTIPIFDGMRVPDERLALWNRDDLLVFSENSPAASEIFNNLD